MPNDPSNTKLPTSIDTGENKPGLLETIKLKRRGFIVAALVFGAGFTSACNSSPEQIRTQEVISFNLSCLTDDRNPDSRTSGEAYNNLLKEFEALGVIPNDSGVVSLNKEALESKGVKFSYMDVNLNDARQGRNPHVEDLVITIKGKSRYIGKELITTRNITLPKIVTR